MTNEQVLGKFAEEFPGYKFTVERGKLYIDGVCSFISWVFTPGEDDAQGNSVQEHLVTVMVDAVREELRRRG